MKISLQHVLFDFVIDGLTKFETRKNKKNKKQMNALQQPHNSNLLYHTMAIEDDK